MNKDDLIRMASTTAKAHGLLPSLVCAVCEHESVWNEWAIRYEPAFEKRYDPADPMHEPTEHYSRAFSYGLMQIMGETARELGFTGAYLSELCDAITGLEYGCRKLSHCLALHPNDMTAALLAYNGGADPAYPGMVLALRKNYGGMA